MRLLSVDHISARADERTVYVSLDTEEVGSISIASWRIREESSTEYQSVLEELYIKDELDLETTETIEARLVTVIKEALA